MSMDYSPTLKAAMEEIKAVLDKHDIAGAVILHKPHYGKGMGEFMLKLNPSYSCVKMSGNDIRIQARLTEDFHNNKKAMEDTITKTSNMLSIMASMADVLANNLADLSVAMDGQIGAVHDEGTITDHLSTQN